MATTEVRRFLHEDFHPCHSDLVLPSAVCSTPKNAGGQTSLCMSKKSDSFVTFLFQPALITDCAAEETKQTQHKNLKPVNIDLLFNKLNTELDLELNKKFTTKWTLWLCKNKIEAPDVHDFLNGIWPNGHFETMKEFCELWNAAYGNAKPPYTRLMIFKRGIKPIWEDPQNKKGGKWLVRCSSSQQAICLFIIVCIRLLCGKFGDTNDFCGAVLSVKTPTQFWIQLWNKNATNTAQVASVKAVLKELFEKKVLYQVHKTSLRMQKVRKIYLENSHKQKEQEKTEPENEIPSTEQQIQEVEALISEDSTPVTMEPLVKQVEQILESMTTVPEVPVTATGLEALREIVNTPIPMEPLSPQAVAPCENLETKPSEAQTTEVSEGPASQSSDTPSCSLATSSSSDLMTNNASTAEVSKTVELIQNQQVETILNTRSLASVLVILLILFFLRTVAKLF